MNTAVKAYTAGIIDGEGCIFVGLRGGNTSANFVLKVQVAVVDKPLTDWLHEHWGGTVRVRKPSGKMLRESYEWTISAASAGSMLDEIKDYLVIKSEQAEIALDFQARKVMRGKGVLTEEELAVRARLAQELRDLKRTTY